MIHHHIPALQKRMAIFIALFLIFNPGFAQELTTHLPIVIINTNGQEIPDEPKIEAEMGIIDNGPGEINHQNDPFNDYAGNIGIEVRGQSSQYFYPKKSYSFETRDEAGENLDVSILGMPEENDWVLYAPYGDKSMLRNFISFWIARKMDVYVTRTVFCEVILNGEYMGVYVMMEKIKKDEERVNIAKLRPEDNYGDELTGGYIIRVDKTDDFQWGVDGWQSFPDPPFPNAMNIIYQYYYPKSDDITSFQKEYIREYVGDTEDALIAADFDDPDVGYNLFLNTGSFVDHMLVNEVSKEVDKYRYSTYFYKEKDSDGGKLFAGPAWDFNLGYANVDYWEPGVEIPGWIYDDVEPVDWSIMFWWKRLMQDSYFRNLAKTRWEQLREEEISDENFQYVIDSVVGYIQEAQERNYEKWPILGEYVWPNYNWQNNDYDDEVEFFSNWLFERLAWIDDNLPGVTLQPSADLSLIFNNDVLEVKLNDDYFSRTILKNKYFDVNDPPPDFEIDTVVYVDASTAYIYFDNPSPEEASISITIDKKVINSFSGLTTSSIILGMEEGGIVEDNLKIYMSASGLTIHCKTPEKLGDACLIFDVHGRLAGRHSIKAATENQIGIHLPEGAYIVTLPYGDLQISEKILIR